MTADRSSDKTYIVFLFMLQQSMIESMGVTEHPLQKSQLLKFYLLFVRVYRGKNWNFWRFLEFFMKSHMMIVKTLSEHIIMVILHWGQKMLFLNKNNFISQNYRSFTQTTVMGKEKILWKFELDQSIFLDFTGIGSLKYKEIRVSGAKLFLRSIDETSFDIYIVYLCEA